MTLTYLAAEQPYSRGIGILVKQDSPLQSVKDLKEKKVAIGRGWNAQYLLVRALKANGLSRSNDSSLVTQAKML